MYALSHLLYFSIHFTLFQNCSSTLVPKLILSRHKMDGGLENSHWTNLKYDFWFEIFIIFYQRSWGGYGILVQYLLLNFKKIWIAIVFNGLYIFFWYHPLLIFMWCTCSLAVFNCYIYDRWSELSWENRDIFHSECTIYFFGVLEGGQTYNSSMVVLWKKKILSRWESVSGCLHCNVC